jgi:hypothetical protein
LKYIRRGQATAKGAKEEPRKSEGINEENAKRRKMD